MWRWIYDPNTGVLNDILLRLSIIQVGVPWLADPGNGALCGDRHPRLAGLPVLRRDDPGGAAGHPEEPVRGRVDRWRERMAAVPPHHASGDCAGSGHGRSTARDLGREFDRRHLRDDGRRSWLCHSHAAALRLHQAPGRTWTSAMARRSRSPSPCCSAAVVAFYIRGRCGRSRDEQSRHCFAAS